MGLIHSDGGIAKSRISEVTQLNLNLPDRFNAAEYFVDRNVDEGRGDKTAILFEDQSYTYAQFLEKVNRTGNVLTELGVGMEDRVMLLLRDTPEMLFSF